jgi:hypothetical protein
MNLSDMRLPRQLEADNTAEEIFKALASHTVKLRSDSDIDIPVIAVNDPLKAILRKARLKGQLCFGFEAIFDKLENERKGIANVRARMAAPYGDRISRLLLFSNDGAERLYRHIEQALNAHAPRLLGCLLDIDCIALGHLITDKESRIKIVMAEHKEIVSAILRTTIDASV